jgi:hypothetical protein
MTKLIGIFRDYANAPNPPPPKKKRPSRSQNPPWKSETKNSEMSTRIKSRVMILRAGISTSCERARNDSCGLYFGLHQLMHEAFPAWRTNGTTYGDVLPNCAHQFWSTGAPHFFRSNKLDTTYDTDRQTDTWWRLKSTVQYERTIFNVCPVLDRLHKYILQARRRKEEVQLLHESISHTNWETTETKPGKQLNFGICIWILKRTLIHCSYPITAIQEYSKKCTVLQYKDIKLKH